MSDNNDHKEQRIGLWLAGGAAALSVLVVLFYSIWGWETGKIEGSPTYGQAASGEVVEQVSTTSMIETASGEMVMETTETVVLPASAASNPAAVILQEPVAVADDARAVVENGVVKFYFATGKADLAANAEEALVDVLAGVKLDKKAIISGYNDSTGNAAANEELAKKRAFAVRNALLGFGVPESQIEMRKPADTNAGQGNDAEARRVEVTLE